MLIFVRFFGFIKNSCLYKSKFFSGFAPFKHGKKRNFLSISVLISEIVTFNKKEVLHEFPPKSFKTTEMHSLAVCGSLCGGKRFLLIFIPFYWFDQKEWFKQIQIFLRISPFSNMVRKTNFLSISMLVSEIVSFLTKKIRSCELPQKCFKTTERHMLAVCGSLCWENQFLLIFVPF